MINYTTLEDGIYGIVQPILNCVTIFSESNAPRPKERPYALINVEATKQVGREEVAAPDAVTGVSEVGGHYILTAQFTAYGAGAKNAINKLQFAFNRPTVVDAFDAIGLAVVSHDNVLDIPAIRDTIWEESSRFSATFHVRITDSDAVGVIETVTVTGDLLGDVDASPDEVNVSTTITPIAP